MIHMRYWVDGFADAWTGGSHERDTDHCDGKYPGAVTDG